jgi:hypothetical protein
MEKISLTLYLVVEALITQLQISAMHHRLLSVLKPDVSGTFPVDRFWGGERARRV